MSQADDIERDKDTANDLQQKYEERARAGYWVPEGEDVPEILFTDMTIPHLNNAVVVTDSILPKEQSTRLLCRPYLVAELKQRGIEK